MAYIGNSLTQQSFTGGMDQFNGNASNTTFGLSRTITTPFDINVYVEGVFQRPGVAYTTTANTITFTSAPSTGANNIVVIYENFTSTSVVPAPGSVVNQSLGSITNINAGAGAGMTLQANNTTYVTLAANGSLAVGNTSITNLTVTGNTIIGANSVVVTSDIGRFDNLGIRLRSSQSSTMAGLMFMPTTSVISNDVVRFYNADDATGVNVGSVGLGWEGANNRQFSITSKSWGTGVSPLAMSISGMKLLCAQGLGDTPIFYVKQTTSQTLGNGINAKIYYNTSVYDTNSFFTVGTSGTTSRFLPTIAGYYLLTANYRSNTTGAASCDMAFYVNGSNYIAQHINQQGTNDQGGFISAIVYLNGSQYVEVWVNQNSGGSTTTNNSDNLGGTGMTWWQGMLIRAA